MDGKQYKGVDLFNALENIGVNVAPMRLLVEELLELSNEDEMHYSEGLANGKLYLPYQDGHTVYIKAHILLNIICDIEKLIKAFGVNPY